MSYFRFFKTHRTWEDWCGMGFGVLIALSPWFAVQTGHEFAHANPALVILNTVLVGILVLGLAQLEYAALQRWEEVAEIILGVWLISSPYVLGYFDEGLLRIWHLTLGVLVVLLAALQLWQDWNLSNHEMLNH